MTRQADDAGSAWRTEIASHRGGARLWPENSRIAFRNSAALPVDFIEFDIHRSCDGVLVVHHDAVLGRTAQGTGVIAEMEWAQLRSAPLLGTEGETIPSLAEVLDILRPRPVKLRVEVKTRSDGSRYPGIEAEIIASLAGQGLLQRTTFTAFDLPTLRDLALAVPDRPLIWLVPDHLLTDGLRDLAALCRQASAAGVAEIAIRATHMQAGDLAICRAEAIRFGLFAVHDEAAIELAFATGVCAFTTDRPDLALALRPKAG